MDYYKILGIERNASKEEIKEVYEMQVKKIKKEVTNEKTLKPFLKLFDEAYEALINEENKEEKVVEKENLINKEAPINREVYSNETVVMQPHEIEYELEKQKLGRQEIDRERSKNSSSKNESKRKTSSSSRKKKDSGRKDVSKDVSKDKDKDRDGERTIKQRSRKKENNNSAAKWIALPLRILALPLIAVLSIMILFCQVINIVSWLASKVMIVGGIAIGAIHLYQIKLGQAPNNKILFLAGVGVVASFFLPYILRVVPRVLGKLNNKLKKFVF